MNQLFFFPLKSATTPNLGYQYFPNARICIYFEQKSHYPAGRTKILEKYMLAAKKKIY